MKMYFQLLNLHFWIVWKLKFFVLLADLVPLILSLANLKECQRRLRSRGHLPKLGQIQTLGVTPDRTTSTPHFWGLETMICQCLDPIEKILQKNIKNVRPPLYYTTQLHSPCLFSRTVSKLTPISENKSPHSIIFDRSTSQHALIGRSRFLPLKFSFMFVASVKIEDNS